MTEADPKAQIERLERRLVREREARLAAEAIAEKGLRDLYEKKRHLRLLETVSAAANRSHSVPETVKFALDHVCDFTGWPLGHVFLVGDGVEAGVLTSTRIWHAPDDPKYDEFRSASEKVTFEFGVGVPGRVAACGSAIWVCDIDEDDNFPRASVAQACGIHAAFAFPVIVDGEAAAVLEFFSPQRLEPDEALMSTVAAIGAQLGQVIERARSETQLKRHNAELERLYAEAEAQRAKAEEASRAKSAFLAVTSHEIRTPLNAVLGLAEAMRREPLNDRQRELNDGILDSGRLLLRLLNAVLDLSKIEAGKVELDERPFDLRLRAKGVVRIWGARAQELGLKLELDLDGLPDPCWLVADEGKVEQTLVNLLSNAMKFSPRGSRVRVRASLRADGGAWRARLEVHDQGPGVAEADRVRIFQPFEQTETGREAGGAGLGLAICAGNAALMGGAVGADVSAEGETLFWLDFPAQAHDGTAKAHTDTAAETAPAVLDRPLRVLAAEDNPANRQVLKVLLEPAELDLTFAVNGAEAVAASGAARFDLVLMDANMPVMDGVTAVREIRARDGKDAPPILMLTANVFEDDVRLYRAAGVDGVLKKPVDVRELYGALAHAAGLVAEQQNAARVQARRRA